MLFRSQSVNHDEGFNIRKNPIRRGSSAQSQNSPKPQSYRRKTRPDCIIHIDSELDSVEKESHKSLTARSHEKIKQYGENPEKFVNDSKKVKVIPCSIYLCRECEISSMENLLDVVLL